MRAWTLSLAFGLACLWTVGIWAAEPAKDTAKKQQRASVEERFKKMDTDNNGILTEKEFVAAYTRMGEEKAKDLFKKLGGSAIQGLTLEQYKKGREELAKKRAEEAKKPRQKQ